MGDKLFLVFTLLLSTVNCELTNMTATSDAENAGSADEAQVSSLADMQGTEPSAELIYLPETQENKENTDADNSNLEEDNSPVGEIKKIFDVLDAVISGGNEKTDQNDDTGISFPAENSEESSKTSSSDYIETMHEGSASENSPISTPYENFGDTTETRESPLIASTVFDTMAEQLLNSASTPENTPVLMQGGYGRPYQQAENSNDQSQKLSSESAIQTAEPINSPNENLNNGERLGRARISSFPTPFFPSPSRFNPNPVMSNPFAPSMNTMRIQNGPFQNSFYNTQPDLSQRQYSQLVNPGEFPGVRFTVQTAHRTPLQNFGLFQNPFQFPISQPVPANIPGQMPTLFQTSGSPAYSNFESGLESPATDFASLFENAPASAQFQENPNQFGSNQNLGRNIFANPSNNPLTDFSNVDNGFSPRFLNYPMSDSQTENINGEQKLPEQGDRIDEIPKEDVAVPFGTRIQKPNEEKDQSDFKRQDNLYIRYPIAEAGYATEENLPAQNDTEKKGNININEIPMQQTFPFFSLPRRYNVFNGPDPYKIALENVKREYPSSLSLNLENKNTTGENESESMSLKPDQSEPELLPERFRGYPERNPGFILQDAPFYAEPNPFQPMAIFPGSYPFSPRPNRMRESNKTPKCALLSNSSFCFKDDEYPKGAVLYSLNSNPILLESLAPPEESLAGISLVEQNKTETPESEDNYICKSEIKYGSPLRAQNIKGDWKIIVKAEGGRGNFDQPVRLEVCSGAGDPCRFTTEVKTACVQKYSLQRLVSWSVEKGVHNDIFKLPIACSCQILEEKA